MPAGPLDNRLDDLPPPLPPDRGRRVRTRPDRRRAGRRGCAATFYGVQGATTAEAIDTAGGAGIGTLGLSLYWGDVEPRPGVRDWQRADVVMASAARAGMTALVRLQGSPSGWLTAHPRHPPRTHDARRRFARFARDAVRRYGPDGAFWVEHAAGSADPLPYRPVRAWQVWNEPNLRFWWRARARAVEYALLLKATAPTIRRADPRAKVVLAGLSARSSHVWLDRLYRVAPGIAAQFDIAALHSYGPTAAGVLGAVRRMRRVMRRHRDRSSIWLTEIGWATGGVWVRWQTSPEGQALHLVETYTMLARHRRRLGIRGAIWYSWQDSLHRPEAWVSHCGLFAADGRPKPAWEAMRWLATVAPRERDPAPLDPYAPAAR